MPLTANALMAKAQQELEDLRREDERLRRTIEGIETKRADIARRREELESAVRVFGEMLPAEDANIVKRAIVAAAGVATSLLLAGTIADASQQYMQARGGRAAVTELVSALQEAKRVSADGQAAYGVIYTTLLRDKRFRKVGPGEFELTAPEITYASNTVSPNTLSSDGIVRLIDPKGGPGIYASPSPETGRPPELRTEDTPNEPT